MMQTKEGKKVTWYKWHPADFIGATALLLEPLDRAIYRNLLDQLFLAGGWLPDDDDMLAKLSEFPDYWPTARIRLFNGVKPFLLTNGSIIWNDRMARDLVAAGILHQKQVQAGRNTQAKLAAQRAGQEFDAVTPKIDVITPNSDNPLELLGATGDLQVKHHITSEETSKNSKKDMVKTPKRGNAKPYTDLFEKFWSMGIRKVGKGAASKSFAAALKKTDPGTLFMAWANINEWHRQAGTPNDKIPHPATWLNQGRWDDELDPLPVREKTSGQRLAEMARGDDVDPIDTMKDVTPYEHD